MSIHVAAGHCPVPPFDDQQRHKFENHQRQRSVPNRHMKAWSLDTEQDDEEQNVAKERKRHLEEQSLLDAIKPPFVRDHGLGSFIPAQPSDALRTPSNSVNGVTTTTLRSRQKLLDNFEQIAT
jgi:hypothetical protein